MPADLATLLEHALGCPVADLEAADATDVADALRAIASLPTPTPSDRHLADELAQAAELIDGRGRGAG